MALDLSGGILDLITPVPLVQKVDGGIRLGVGTKALNAYAELGLKRIEVGANVGPIYANAGVDFDLGGVYAVAGWQDKVEVGGFVGLGGALGYIDAPVADFYVAGVASISDFAVQRGTSAETAETVWSAPNPVGRLAMGLVQGMISGFGRVISSAAGNSGATQAPAQNGQQYSLAPSPF